jgi:hypothetical protein
VNTPVPTMFAITTAMTVVAWNLLFVWPGTLKTCPEYSPYP